MTSLLLFIVGLLLGERLHRAVAQWWERSRKRRTKNCEECGGMITNSNRVSLQRKGEGWHYFNNAICARKWVERKMEEEDDD